MASYLSITISGTSHTIKLERSAVYLEVSPYLVDSNSGGIIQGIDIFYSLSTDLRWSNNFNYLIISLRSFHREEFQYIKHLCLSESGGFTGAIGQNIKFSGKYD